MTSNHAPGPYEVHYGEDYTRILKPGAHTDDYIAQVADPADAPILAAAPDLLAALEGLEEYAGAVLDEVTDQDTGWFYQLKAKAHDARAAITKAKGGPS